MKLNKEELIIASILTTMVAPFPIAFIAIPICAFLWALTGSESKYNYKLWRRLGVPLIWATCLWKWQVILCVPISFGFLTLGYGIPSLLDEGSWLGKIAWKLTGYNVLWSNIITRGIIYTGAVLPFITYRVLHG